MPYTNSWNLFAEKSRNAIPSRREHPGHDHAHRPAHPRAAAQAPQTATFNENPAHCVSPQMSHRRQAAPTNDGNNETARTKEISRHDKRDTRELPNVSFKMSHRRPHPRSNDMIGETGHPGQVLPDGVTVRAGASWPASCNGQPGPVV